MLRKFLPLEESRAAWVTIRVGEDIGIHLGGRHMKDLTENQSKSWNYARNP